MGSETPSIENHCWEDGWNFSLCLVAQPLNSKGCNPLMSHENLGYILSWSWSAQIASCSVDCAQGRSINGVKMREKDGKTKAGSKAEESCSWRQWLWCCFSNNFIKAGLISIFLLCINKPKTALMAFFLMRTYTRNDCRCFFKWKKIKISVWHQINFPAIKTGWGI